MIIIIETQNGEILQCNKVSPSGTQIVGDYEAKELNDGIGGTITTQNYEWLGKYKTEEKALEVMEEIKDHIKECYVNDMIKNVATLDMEKENFSDVYDLFKHHENVAIFTMPKK